MCDVGRELGVNHETPARLGQRRQPRGPAACRQRPALGLHRDMANYTVAAIAASIITAILWRRAAAGPRWLVTVAVAVFILTALQTFLGYRLVLAVHIPLGVIVILLLVALPLLPGMKGPMDAAAHYDPANGVA